MSIRMMSPLPARVAQVLKDYLPTELALIDAEEADSLTTPVIESGDYYEWDTKYIARYPACSIRTVSSTPFEVRPDTFGKRIDADHRIDVRFHLTIGQANADNMRLQKFMHRYIAGAARVLCVMYEALQTVADPIRYAELVTWAEPATYGPEEDQGEGTLVRTATLPISVRLTESR